MFAWVLRTVGDSVAVDVARLGGAIEVCSDSFGLFAADGLVCGITESIAPASCRRSWDVWGDRERCLAGRVVE